jgi:hypothetical protein
MAILWYNGRDVFYANGFDPTDIPGRVSEDIFLTFLYGLTAFVTLLSIFKTAGYELDNRRTSCKTIGLSRINEYAFYISMALVHFAGCGTRYLYIWGTILPLGVAYQV